MGPTTYAATLAAGCPFAPARIAETLCRTKAEVARTVNRGCDALMRPRPDAKPKTRNRPREVVEFLNRVEPRLGAALIDHTLQRDRRAGRGMAGLQTPFGQRATLP
jgi:hypothetical protein